MRLANTSPCTNGETSETACGFVVEFADIISEQKMNNSSGTNVGGWPASDMRTYVNGTIYDSLPSKLQNIIVETRVVSSHGSTAGEVNFTSSDKLYLLSSKEVWGNDESSYAVSNDTAEKETRQLDYYKSKGVTAVNYSGTIKYGSNDFGVEWHLRSADSSSRMQFFTVGSSGNWSEPLADINRGVSPAFRIA